MINIVISKKQPYLDECRNLVTKIIEQSIKDFIALENSKTPIDIFYYETARDFLFDKNYTIDWGGEEKLVQDLFDIVDIDREWIQNQLKKRKQK